MDRQFSSGGIVFKKRQKDVLWLVTASAPNELYPKVFWRLPKGWIDNETHDIPGPMASGKVKADEDSLQRAALREVHEEAGVNAKIIKKIGTAKFFVTFKASDKWQGGKFLKFVTFYLMEYESDRPEGYDDETSEIRWMPYEEAEKILSFGPEKEMLKKAREMLKH